MKTEEAIAFIQPAGETLRSSGNWADLGCGTGIFSMALSHYLPEDSIVYAVDRTNYFHQDSEKVRFIKADFVKDPLPLKALDGILMANALHYVKDQLSFLKKLSTYIKPGAKFIVIEYDKTVPIPAWVPYPVSFARLTDIFQSLGYTSVEKIGEKASIYGNDMIYAALIAP
ncbi:methyltransferase domain-containing protein [Sinomicrobium weinanense]|uniref:Class I SAM-dependent methyltransferase n=1 Tax=Sinomicrobium weinanense TaxID=2842200 RepID=A0A926JTQ4_9FLAO|nr:class I SAM-dependent methyltransferase [Sinomicrobium weinanense]MBU3124518.1 class I SAM-dependent methyltransferase [Sinomicrobium weinanense]